MGSFGRNNSNVTAPRGPDPSQSRCEVDLIVSVSTEVKAVPEGVIHRKMTDRQPV